jgi:transcriptional regulator with XRE-family HTH domain
MRDPKAVFTEFAAADRAHRELWEEVRRDGGKLLAQIRDQLGLTQRGLQDVLGVSFTWISKVENDHEKMSRDVAVRLAQLLSKPPKSSKSKPRAKPRPKGRKPAG